MGAASFFPVDDMKHLVEIKESRYHPTGSIQRKFKLSTLDEVAYLIETYIDNFAFGILFNNIQFSLYKDGSAYYIRNNNAQIFKNKFDKPSITSAYDLKADVFEEIVEFIKSA
ncbi:MAG: hypothetical protein ACQEXX_01635 [Bacillota bacterium]